MVVHDVEFIVSPEKINNFTQATLWYQILQEFIEYIHWWWSLHHQKLSLKTQKYLHFCDELSLCRGMVLTGSQIRVPATTRSEILEKLHLWHQGRTKLHQRESCQSSAWYKPLHWCLWAVPEWQAQQLGDRSTHTGTALWPNGLCWHEHCPARWISNACSHWLSL